MTDQQLRDELHRIAEDAPTAYVPSDTFTRGRRAHRRSVGLLVGTVAGAIALVAGAIALAPTRNSADVDPARSRADLAVPDTIYATPTWLAESEDGRYSHADDLEQDLAIGVGAVAYVQPAEDSNTGVAVVIDADDGDYHPLDLPDFIGLDPYWEKGTGDGVEHRPLALSPDGRHLAWAWGTGRDAGSDSQEIPSGVRIADLTTGQVTDWDLSPDKGTYVSDLEWSDGGERLLWLGSQMDRWDYQSYVPGDPIAGVIDPESTSVNFYRGKFRGGSNLSIWAVADNGAIAFNGAYDSGDLQLQSASGEITAVALPAKASMGEPVTFDGADLYISTVDGLAPLGGTGSTWAAPDALPLQLIGWAGDAPLVTSSSSSGDAYIAQLGTSKDARVLIEFDDAGHLASTVSIAYALIDTDATNPTIHRGKPHFVPPWVRTALPWLVAGGLAVAIWWRRRSSSAAADQRTTTRVAHTVAVIAGVTLLVGFVAGLMLIDPAGLTAGSSGQDRPKGLVTISSTITADAPSPSRAVIPREIRWTDDPEKHVPVSDSLAVGRATLAFPDETGIMGDGGSAVVITATGDYRRLDLPNVDEISLFDGESPAVRLSPDGVLLAYLTEDPGLNVVDLETGEVAEHPVELNGDRITSFSWSPDSGWLVWHSNYQGQTAGRIAPDGTTEPLPKGNWANAGIGNDGTVAVRTVSETRIWPEGAEDLPGAGQGSMSTWVGSGAPVDGVDDLGVRSIGSDSSLDVDLAIGRNPSVRGVDVDARSLVGVAGWIADGTPLIVTAGDDGNDLRSVFPDGGTEVIAHLDFPVAQLTIATALPADLAVTPPDPAWARTSSLPMILLIAGAIGIAGFFVWRRVRLPRT